MRPPPGEYILNGMLNKYYLRKIPSNLNSIWVFIDHDLEYFAGGIFLLLGYSSMDEELLRAYTNLGIQDTIRAFQQYIYNHIDNQVCMTVRKDTVSFS